MEEGRATDPFPSPSSSSRGIAHSHTSFTGSGLAVLRSHSQDECSFTHLTSTFPLKLLSPSTSSRNASLRRSRCMNRDEKAPKKAIAALYVVGYGGGLVSGDCVSVDYDVGQHCVLLLLTQGSTKVFKQRRGETPSDDHLPFQTRPSRASSQTFRFLVRREATLVVLPEPVTCFARSNYEQVQRFDLRDRSSSSLALLDWFTPGRTHYQKGKGVPMAKTEGGGNSDSCESWAFDSYLSKNEVRLQGTVLARDTVLLEQNNRESASSSFSSPSASLADRCKPFECYATLLLVGPEFASLRYSLSSLFSSSSTVRKSTSRAVVEEGASEGQVLWSCSVLNLQQPVDQGRVNSREGVGDGLVVRVAGKSTESVRSWLRDHLVDMKVIIGDDLFRQAFG